jgi:hypothetical protein
MESINIEISLKDIQAILDKLKYIENSEINKYLKKKNSEIKYGNIAHLYFHLSVEVYKILSSKKIYNKCKFRSILKLKEAYKEILDVFNLINHKDPSDKTDREESKESIFQNKKYFLDSLNHYGTIMVSIENRRINYLTIIISVIALFISIIYLFNSYI